ncbi:MAG: hypothetical protein R3B36_11005 [Polyangiaceae bacterium]
MRMISVVLTSAALACLVAAPACKKKEDAAKGETPATSSSTTAAKAPAAMNQKLVSHVHEHAEKCTVNVEQGQAYSCKDGITNDMSKYMRDTKPTDFASTMIALVNSTEDDKVSAAAVALFSEQFDYLGDDGKKKNATPEVVDAAIKMWKAQKGNRASRLASPVTQLATLAGASDKIFAAAAEHEEKGARDNAYRYVLKYGRLDALPKLQEIAKDKEEHRRASLDAVTKMPKLTEAERSIVCPWAQGYLGDSDLGVASEAGQAMVYCKGEFVDALLGEAEKRLAAKEYKDPFATVMREPCFQFIKDITDKSGTQAQCDKVYAFLEKAANDKNVDDRTRGLALWNIYYQRRDETTLKLMRKYEKHPNKEISKRAGEAIKSLKESYKLKG